MTDKITDEELFESYTRPRTRADCRNQPRPCPWVGCRHHLYLDIDKFGVLRIVDPKTPVWKMKESCSLDVAEKGDSTLEVIGSLFLVTRERIRQIEEKAIRLLNHRVSLGTLRFDDLGIDELESIRAGRDEMTMRIKEESFAVGSEKIRKKVAAFARAEREKAEFDSKERTKDIKLGKIDFRNKSKKEGCAPDGWTPRGGSE